MKITPTVTFAVALAFAVPVAAQGIRKGPMGPGPVGPGPIGLGPVGPGPVGPGPVGPGPLVLVRLVLADWSWPV